MTDTECPTCGGDGWVAYTPGPGQMHDDEQDCPTCKGTGKASEPLCEACRIERNRLAREYYARRR